MSEFFESIKKGLNEAIDYEDGKPISVRRNKITVESIHKYDPSDIKSVRRSFRLSQLNFSRLLGVSPKTVEAWESGRNVPQGPALRMIDLMKKEPSVMRHYISNKKII